MAAAVACFERAVALGHPGAAYHLGLARSTGTGTQRDLCAAATCFRFAAETGHKKALFALGRALYHGEGVARDVVEGVRCLQRAADAGHALATFYIGNALMSGVGVPAKDEAAALRMWRTSAEAGCHQAQCQMGVVYHMGGIASTPRNPRTAVSWWRRAVDSPQAHYYLALALAAGDGVPQDATAAASHLQVAASAGHFPAARKLGLAFSLGDGVTRDAAAAVRWTRKAAEAGNAQAMCALALAYARGDGIARDASAALSWHRRAANGGVAESAFAVGRSYEGGGDVAEAVRWWRKAVALGSDSRAHWALVRVYITGSGAVRCSPREAGLFCRSALWLCAPEAARSCRRLGAELLRAHLLLGFTALFVLTVAVVTREGGGASLEWGVSAAAAAMEWWDAGAALS